ncbi:MAG: YDG domain-containing protein, partial [Treponema sp.]|nr:YDG domain-containing protein [Treponema sp.]
YDSAIPPTNAGTYYIMATTAGGTVPPLYPAVTDPIRVGTLIIARKDLTWATQGVVADKIYDRTTNTTVTTQPTLAGVIAGDTVTVTTDDIVVVFTSRNANTSVSVTASGYGVIGASIANYIVPSGQPPFTNAAINRKPLTWAADGEAADKPYDRTPAATAATQPTLVGVETGDTVTRVNGTVTFNNMNVGTDIGVTATGYGINGADADNYNAPVDQPVFATAAITAKTITITGVAATNRSFSPGNTTVAISGGTLVGVEPGDTVNAVVPTTGTIATADAENNKAVTIADITLSGAQTDNYALTQPSGLTVHITKADGAAVSVPVMTAHTHNSITVNATLAEATGQAIAYARNTTNEAPETGWQTDGVFTGLSSGTFYFFFARSVFNDNYETGDASAGAEIATLQAVPQNQFAYYWVNQQDILATTDFAGDGSISLSRGAGHTLTITADGTGYTDQRWSVNGINDASYPIGSIEYIFSAAGKTVGAQYTIGLRVVNGGRYYNTNFVVTITE